MPAPRPRTRTGPAPATTSARRARLVAAVCAAALLVVGAAGCSDDASTSVADDGGNTPTVAADAPDAGAGHGSSGMAPETMSVQDVAALGPGPAEGDDWQVWFGLNVCGRFVELPAAGPLRGLTLDEGGLLGVAPGPGDPTGTEVTVGDVLELIGVDVGTGELSFPPDMEPATLPFAGGSVDLAGQTLRTGDDCGPTRGEVQVWVYTPEAVASGEGVGAVVTDPGDVPVVADGMALTVAFMPESSLPTLPPPALLGG